MSFNLHIEKGQTTCTRSCSVLVKFDSGKADYYDFYEIGDKSLSIYSFDRKLTKRLYAAKHMTARIHFSKMASRILN